MNPQTCSPTTSCKQASPQSFIFMGIFFILGMGVLHGIGILTEVFTLGQGFISFMGAYISGITFLIVGLAMNWKQGKKTSN